MLGFFIETKTYWFKCNVLEGGIFSIIWNGVFDLNQI